MSIVNHPHFELGLSQHLYKTSPSPVRGSYAFRIGYVGSEVQRFDKNLLGKVLDAHVFEESIIDERGKNIATKHAIKLLETPLDDFYPADRQRLVLANLTGLEKDHRIEKLRQAIAWLKEKKVAIIYFQYHWMVTTQMKQALGLYDVEYAVEDFAVP